MPTERRLRSDQSLAYAGVLPRNDQRIDSCHPLEYQATHHGSPERRPTAKHVSTARILAITLLELAGKRSFLRMFYTILAANTSPDTLTTFEWCGTTRSRTLHSVASMIRMARRCSWQERDDGLYLLARHAARAGSSRPGRFEISSAPTNYGELSLKTHSDSNTNGSAESMFKYRTSWPNAAAHQACVCPATPKSPASW